MTSAELPAAVRAARAVEEAGGLDGTVNLLGDAFDALVGRRPALTATLQGRQLGHSLHPLLTDLPIGLWTASAALDLVGGPSSRAAADRLLGLGLLAVAPTALSGWADWSASGTRVRRVGVVHAALNSGAAVLLGASWLLRRAGHRGAGVAVAMVANLVVTGGGYLGGHMVYRLGAPTGGPMATRHPAQEVVPRAPLRAA